MTTLRRRMQAGAAAAVTAVLLTAGTAPTPAGVPLRVSYRDPPTRP